MFWSSVCLLNSTVSFFLCHYVILIAYHIATIFINLYLLKCSIALSTQKEILGFFFELYFLLDGFSISPLHILFPFLIFFFLKCNLLRSWLTVGRSLVRFRTLDGLWAYRYLSHFTHSKTVKTKIRIWRFGKYPYWQAPVG